jgi:hypothetical protein
MNKRYNPYIKQAIETAEESKKNITISREIIESTNDDRLLGMLVRGMFIEKIRNCDEYIEHMKSLKENYPSTDSPDELQ